MKTRHVVLAAIVAGALGVAASLAIDPAGLSHSRLGRVLAPAADEHVPVADHLPALELAGRDGRPRSLQQVIGPRPALINFWASWCRPCLEEMPALDAFSRQQGANGLQVVGIALDEPAEVERFLRARPVGYPILIDRPGPEDASVRLGNARGVLPYSVLVAADGRILRRWAGPLEPRDLEAWAKAARTRD